MKTKIIITLLLAMFAVDALHSQVNGTIISDQDKLTVVKVWGTHQERGFAYGYLLADKIKDIYEGYLMPNFGNGLTSAKQLVQQGQVFTIAPEYVTESQAIYDGMVAAGFTISNGDYLDVLVANTFLDLMGIDENFGNKLLENGCSSLMTWGDGSNGSVDAGKAFISRHLDWTAHQKLLDNQVLVVHFPSETNEQPWAHIGFAGLMSVLSGFNNSGLSAFQHMLSDFNQLSTINPPYTPIWFSLREALEKVDYNNDGQNNTNDVRDALLASANGFADGYIVSVLAEADNLTDSLVAMVAEVCPKAPTHTIRYNDYPDNIPGDNLYAANYEIKRNNHQHYCSRYNATASSFLDSTGISKTDNWEKMKLYSNSGGGNIQFMQFCPADREFLLAWHHNNQVAYQHSPDTFLLDELFSSTFSVEPIQSKKRIKSFKIKQNPVRDALRLEVFLAQASPVEIKVVGLNGNEVAKLSIPETKQGTHQLEVPLNSELHGIYMVQVSGNNFSLSQKFVKY